MQVGLDREVRQRMDNWGPGDQFFTSSFLKPRGTSQVGRGLPDSQPTLWLLLSVWAFLDAAVPPIPHPEPVAYAWEMPRRSPVQLHPGNSYPCHQAGSISRESTFRYS